MTVAPDPVEIAAPRDPALYAPRRGLGLGFWALLAFGVICVAAGAALARFGPAWFAPKVPAVVERPASATPPAAPVESRPLSGGPIAPPPPPVATENVARLESRVALLETGQQRTLDAAAAALAAATLADAAREAQPFAEELVGLEHVLPLSPDLRALDRLARTGAPTRVGLAAEFETLAGRAAVAARDPGRDADVLARLRHALSGIVSVRHVGSAQGSAPDAVLARAQTLLNAGDIERALSVLDALPPTGQTVLAPWRAAAERRIEVDRRIAAIRADALARLARAAPALDTATAYGPAAPVTP